MGGRTLLVLNRGVSFPVAGVRRRIGYTTGRVQAIVAVCESISAASSRVACPRRRSR